MDLSVEISNPQKEKPFYRVYVLMKNNIPIYAGMSTNVKKRVNEHKATKDFDSYILVYQNGSRLKCKEAEVSAITFCRHLNKDSLNKEGISCAYMGLTKLKQTT